MFNMSKEEKFNFDIANLKQDFAIENINITASDIEMLKRYSNQEISESCPGGFTHSMKTPSKGHGEERAVCFALQQLHAGSFRIGRHGAG